MSINLMTVIKNPLITEKGTMHLRDNVYTFEVATAADKTQIAKAIELLFKVKVENVKTMNSRGRAKRVGRFLSKVPHYKKALVKLAPGEKIKIFEGV